MLQERGDLLILVDMGLLAAPLGSEEPDGWDFGARIERCAMSGKRSND
jgi:hypothetical protein